MKLVLAIMCTFAAVLLHTAPVAAQATDEGQIRALEDRFAAAVRGGDLDAVMKVYMPDQTLFVFDVVPPRQYVGAAAYRKDWAEFINDFEGPVQFDISELAVTVEGNLAFGHSIQHVVGKNKKGQTVDLTVRVTDGYRKIGGNWLIAHEHVSVPVDLETGQADLNSKP